MTVIDFRSAVRQALDEELRRDERVIVFGEDVAEAGGVWATTPGLKDAHGRERVFDTPISELAMTGAAFGAAVCGKRPVVEIMFGDFLGLSMDSLVNQAAKWWYVSNGQASVPLVIRCAVGAGLQFGAVHSQTPIPWFLGVPGIKIVCPSTPNDARALLKSAIRDDNPVLYLEHKRLYGSRGEVDDVEVPIGEAKTLRQGSDVTLVSVMQGVHDCLAAAEDLAREGIEAEVIDLRTVRPMDVEQVAASVARTNRLVAVDEGPKTGGWPAELIASITEVAWGELESITRVTAADTPIPYAPSLEGGHLPSKDLIVLQVRATVVGDRVVPA
ncbi:MAG: alpha-ketoacid dehydrogenase subunit beta [Candidatus Dormibacteraeota bacterium]|nr:alpha-ketoacid dehydrogenase subunit beta [Candidatus Dormibacteraeota bacterium]